MEEILASIRRIIESNDQPAEAPTLSSVTAMPRAEGNETEVEAPSESRPSDGSALQIEEAIVVEPETRETPSFAAANQPGRPISLADVAARLRGAPAAAPQIDQPPATLSQSVAREPQPHDQAEVFAAPVQPATAEAAQATPAKPTPLTDSMSDRWQEDADDDSSFLKPVRESAEASVPPVSYGAPANEVANDRAEQAPAVSEVGGSALMSVATGSQVTAVFEGLGEAMKKSTMRSFDEIAQDMLRPMLSDWLDDNLPTLVERLVREEIERVARGGARR